ncbi:hypothetical protein ISCGN_030128 [Ixodes scapularis]
MVNKVIIIRILRWLDVHEPSPPPPPDNNDNEEESDSRRPAFLAAGPPHPPVRASLPPPTVNWDLLATDAFVHDLVACGFRINPDDSQFIPTKRIRFLGFLLDGETGTIGHTPARYQDLLATLRILDVPRTIPTYQRLAGLWGFYFSLYQGHFHALRPRHRAAATGTLPPREWVELFSFVLTMLPAAVPFVPPTVQYVAFSDASLTGLGICSNKGNIAVICSSPPGIYRRELYAVLFALLCSPPRTLLYCDNAAIVFALTRGHGRTLTYFEALAATLLLSNKQSWLRWLPTAENPADVPSRLNRTLLRGSRGFHRQRAGPT